MTKSEKIRFYYGIFLAVFTAVIGILFIVEAAQIYYSGDGASKGMYSREIVGGKLMALLAPVCLYIAAVIAGFVLSVLFPSAGAKRRGRDDVAVYRRLKKRIPSGGGEDFSPLYASYRRGEFLILCARAACAVFCVAAAVVSIVYLCDAAHFHGFTELSPSGEGYINEDVLNMLAGVMPWVGAALLLVCAETVFEHIYARRALPAVKKMIATGSGEPAPAPFARQTAALSAIVQHPRTTAVLRLLVLVCGIVFLVLALVGFVQNGNGGILDVLNKAIAICSECIGLG